MTDLSSTGGGQAVRWYALAAVVLSVASLAGAQTLEWLSRSGRIALVAERAAPARPAARLADDGGVDTMPTGSVPKGAAPPMAVMIRLR